MLIVDTHVTKLTQGLPWRSPCDKDLIMGRALWAWLDWARPASAAETAR